MGRDGEGGGWRAQPSRYGTSAEEMTLAGFQHAQMLQRNERFARASEKQQAPCGETLLPPPPQINRRSLAHHSLLRDRHSKGA